MDVSDIVDLVNLVSSRDIAELEVERDGMRVRIVKAPVAAAAGGARAYEAPVVARGAQGFAVEQVVAQVVPSNGSGASAAPAAPVEEEGIYPMRSPIVGTFYRSPSPTAEPYAKAGDRVKKGQVICIVEAMKLMNEIESEVGGTVVEVLVEDGQPVEYGEPLYKIRTER